MLLQPSRIHGPVEGIRGGRGVIRQRMADKFRRGRLDFAQQTVQQIIAVLIDVLLSQVFLSGLDQPLLGLRAIQERYLFKLPGGG